MKIRTEKIGSMWRADFIELSGSPCIGDGKNKAEAIACLFLRNKDNFDKLNFNSLEIDGKLWSYPPR